MTTQVHFVPPTNANDLRVVLAAPTIRENDNWGVCYVTQYGEKRFLYWLTEGEANSRAVKLRARGYRAVAGLMDV